MLFIIAKNWHVSMESLFHTTVFQVSLERRSSPTGPCLSFSKKEEGSKDITLTWE